MALGIYKTGQGYWVRVMAATFLGVIILAGSAWLWNQLEKTSQYIPRNSWVLTVSPATGAGAPGQSVSLLGESKSGEKAPVLGSATVESSESGQGGSTLLTVGHIERNSGVEMSQVKGVGPAPASAATISGPLAGNPLGKPLFEPLYLQAAGVALLVLGGSILTYWLVGANVGISEFLIATDGEMKKVNWSTRRDIIGSTWVVIMWSVLIAGGLFAVDLAFSSFFKLIHVLQQ